MTKVGDKRRVVISYVLRQYQRKELSGTKSMMSENDNSLLCMKFEEEEKKRTKKGGQVKEIFLLP